MLEERGALRLEPPRIIRYMQLCHVFLSIQRDIVQTTFSGRLAWTSRKAMSVTSRSSDSIDRQERPTKQREIPRFNCLAIHI